MNNILWRIAKIADNESITIGALEKKIGASKGVLSRALQKNTDIQSKWLQLLVENYPQYNSEWLLTGKGSMLKGKEGVSIEKEQVNIDFFGKQLEKKDIEIKELNREIGRLQKEVEDLKKIQFEQNQSSNSLYSGDGDDNDTELPNKKMPDMLPDDDKPNIINTGGSIHVRTQIKP